MNTETTKVMQASNKSTEKMTEVVHPCEENKRGAHSEKNSRCGHTRETKKREAKHKLERCV